MQFIQSIILIVVTTIVTNLFTRKFYISDKDRIIKEKQFKIYEGLYINIVKNRVNEPILSCLAKKNIYHLINALITNENLYNYLNPLLYEQLTSLKDQKISDSDVADIKNQIEEDLENIKYSLGYPCNGVQREHNKKLNNGLPILHKVPPKRDYGRYFCIMAEKGGTSHGGLTEKLSPFFHAKKQEVNAYGR